MSGFASLGFVLFFSQMSESKILEFWLQLVKHSVHRVLSSLAVWNNPLQGCEH